MLVLIAGIGFWGHAFAEHHEHADPGAEAHKDMGETKEVGNKICPVSGDKIGAMGEAGKVEHEGRIYNLCCPGCEKKFKEDPEKYVGIVNKELEKEKPQGGEAGHLDEHGHDHGHEGHDHK